MLAIADQNVVAVPAREIVVATLTLQPVVAGAALDHIVALNDDVSLSHHGAAAVAGDDVIALVTEEMIVAIVAGDRIDAISPIHDVVSTVAEYEIVAAAGEDNVVAGLPVVHDGGVRMLVSLDGIHHELEATGRRDTPCPRTRVRFVGQVATLIPADEVRITDDQVVARSAHQPVGTEPPGQQIVALLPEQPVVSLPAHEPVAFAHTEAPCGPALDGGIEFGPEVRIQAIIAIAAGEHVTSGVADHRVAVLSTVEVVVAVTAVDQVVSAPSVHHVVRTEEGTDLGGPGCSGELVGTRGLRTGRHDGIAPLVGDNLVGAHRLEIAQENTFESPRLALLNEMNPIVAIAITANHEAVRATEGDREVCADQRGGHVGVRLPTVRRVGLLEHTGKAAPVLQTDGSLVRIDIDRVGPEADDVGIEAFSPGEKIVALAATKLVALAPAFESVVVPSSIEMVGPGLAIQLVLPAPPQQRVPARAAVEIIVPVVAFEVIAQPFPLQDIVAAASVEAIFA